MSGHVYEMVNEWMGRGLDAEMGVLRNGWLELSGGGR